MTDSGAEGEDTLSLLRLLLLLLLLLSHLLLLLQEKRELMLRRLLLLRKELGMSLGLGELLGGVPLGLLQGGSVLHQLRLGGLQKGHQGLRRRCA